MSEFVDDASGGGMPSPIDVLNAGEGKKFSCCGNRIIVGKAMRSLSRQARRRGGCGQLTRCLSIKCSNNHCRSSLPAEGVLIPE